MFIVDTRSPRTTANRSCADETRDATDRRHCSARQGAVTSITRDRGERVPRIWSGDADANRLRADFQKNAAQNPPNARSQAKNMIYFFCEEAKPPPGRRPSPIPKPSTGGPRSSPPTRPSGSSRVSHSSSHAYTPMLWRSMRRQQRRSAICIRIAKNHNHSVSSTTYCLKPRFTCASSFCVSCSFYGRPME